MIASQQYGYYAKMGRRYYNTGTINRVCKTPVCGCHQVDMLNDVKPWQIVRGVNFGRKQNTTTTPCISSCLVNVPLRMA